MSSENIQKFITPLEPVLLEEQKLRMLAIELAKDVVDPYSVFKALEITYDDYERIKETRAFKIMYNAALAEWHGASNTQKRVKFKSAALVEEVLPTFYAAIKNTEEPLSSRVELLKTIAKFGNIGNTEPVVGAGGGGQFFKLEIHLSGKDQPIVVGSSAPPTIEGELTESPLVTAEDQDEL